MTRYLEVQTDQQVSRLLGDVRRELVRQARMPGYWDGLDVPAYISAGRPVPNGQAIHWNPVRGFRELPDYLPGVAHYPLDGGGALVVINAPTRGSKARIRAWLEARPGQIDRAAVSGRFLAKLEEIEAGIPAGGARATPDTPTRRR